MQLISVVSGIISSFSSLLVPLGLLQPFPQTPSCVAGLLHHSGATGTFGTDGHVWRVLSTTAASLLLSRSLSGRLLRPYRRCFRRMEETFFLFCELLRMSAVDSDIPVVSIYSKWKRWPCLQAMNTNVSISIFQSNPPVAALCVCTFCQSATARRLFALLNARRLKNGQGLV